MVWQIQKNYYWGGGVGISSEIAFITVFSTQHNTTKHYSNYKYFRICQIEDIYPLNLIWSEVSKREAATYGK